MKLQTNRSKTCTFIGHRKIKRTEDLVNRLTVGIERLITEKDYDTFLLGSRSEFNDLCVEILSDMKEKYPHIHRIYVRAEYPVIDEKYLSYLLESCDETLYPETLLGAGRAVYVKRNREMIDSSSVCIFLFEPESTPKNGKSGTGLAFEYAKGKGVEIIRI